MDALIVIGFLVGLAIAAPRWGYDSTDGVDSQEWGRRALWWAERPGRTPTGAPRRQASPSNRYTVGGKMVRDWAGARVRVRLAVE